jgi:hypothetical protein
MEMFNENVRRIAALRAYEQRIEDIAEGTNIHGGDLHLLVACADMFLLYMPFDMPHEPARLSMEASGEFTAR